MAAEFRWLLLMLFVHSQHLINAQPGNANYIPIDQIDLTGKLGLVFQVQACESAHVVLSAIFGDTNSRMYEILISGWSNKKSVIRDCRGGCDRAGSPTEGLLKCNESVSLWIGWTDGNIALGKGRELGIDPLVEWQDSSPEYITSFAVGTTNGVNGIWKFTPDDNCSLPLTRSILSNGQVAYSSSSSGLPRFNQNNGWYSHGSSTPWLQVDVLQPHKLTKMALQGYAPGHSYWVKTFQILYSVDGTNWLYYNKREIQQGNSNGHDVAIVDITDNIEARYIRILPITWNSRPGIRMEIYGCQKAESEREYTPIDDDILDEEVLFLHLSPYIVSRLVAIRPGGTLTIQPGVKVIFTTAEAGFDVHGNLLAQGIDNLPVEFTADDAVSEISSHWTGLIFVSGDSLLQHAYVEGARVGIQATGYSVTLDHVTITKCSAGIKYTDGGSFANSTMISDSYIGNNGGHGIEFKGSPAHPFLSITRTIITGSKSSGIYCRDTHANISIEDSELSHNAQRGLETYQTVGNIKIHRAEILRNRNNGLYIYKMSGNTTIESTKMKHNYYYTIYYYSDNNYRGGRFLLINNSFVGESNGPEYYAVYLYPNTFDGDEIQIDRNVFKDIATSYPSLQIENNYKQSELNITITNNVFTNCFKSMLVRAYHKTNVFIEDNTMENNRADSRYIDVQLTSSNTNGRFHIFRNKFTNIAASSWLWIDTDNFIIANNSFEQFKSVDQCALYVSVSKTALIVNVPYSYWGSSDPGDVKDRVCGNSRNMNLAHVTVSPFYTYRNLTELNEDEGVDFYFTDSTGAIGGVLLNNKTISYVFNHTYHVRRSIFIRRNATLTVESGVQLAFGKGIGIYLIGALLIGESGNGDTSMKRMNPTGKWGGIRIGSPSSVGLLLNNVQLDGSTYGVHGSGRNISLQDVTITNTEYAIYVSDTITKYLNIDITNSRIDTSSNTGIYIHTSNNLEMREFNLTIEDVVIRNTRGSGAVYINGKDRSNSKAFIVFENVSIQDSTNQAVYIYYSGYTDIQFRGCEFSEYTSYAIYAYIRHGIFELGDCIIKNRRYQYSRDIYYFTAWTNSGPRAISIYNNTFMDFNSRYNYGMVIINTQASRSGYEESSSIAIVNNTFRSTSSSTSALVLSNIKYFSSIAIEGNIIHSMSRVACVIGLKAGIGTVDIIGNVISESNGALFLTSEQTSGTTIMKNQFLYNFGSDNVIIDPSIRNNCTISYNVFLNNSNNAMTLKRVQSGTLLNYNLFDNIKGEPNYNVKIISSKGGPDINAKFNWWGSKEQSQILASIYDNKRDPSVGVLDIFPFLLSHNFSDVSTEEDFFRQDGSIGGEITGNITLRCDDSPYDVVSDIVVMEEASLLIEPCVVLKFAENIGIRVKGEIHMNGTAEKQIQCIPRTSVVKWAGISITTERAANEKGGIRLVGDTASGRLEVFYNGQWGSVCDDQFDTHDAKVACRHLGMRSEGATYRTVGGGTGPIWLDNIACGGSETTLFECRHNGFGSHNCGHGEDVGITCVGLLSTASRNQVSTLKHVRLLNTTFGLHITGIMPSVFQHVESSRSSQNGITFDVRFLIGNVSNVLLENVKTSENHGNGLFWNEKSYRMSNIEFVNIKSTRNQKFGLYYTGSYQNISVINSLLTDNTYGAVYSSLSTSSLNIESTEISRNTHGALYSNPASDSEFNCTIRDCNITYNGIPSDTSNSTFYFSPNGQRYNGVFFQKNRFIQNTGGRMIHYYGHTGYSSQPVVILSNNTLYENTGVALYMEYISNNARVLFHDNHFEGNNANPAASGNNAYMFYGTLQDRGSFDF
ncbi:unnamed protein product, partial [Owenia fusiformis]